jgi:hypothetical protein
MEIVILTKGAGERAETHAVWTFNTREEACNFCTLVNGMGDKLTNTAPPGEKPWVFARIARLNEDYYVDDTMDFETLVRCNDRTFQMILREADYQDLGKASRDASPKMKEKIRNNMDDEHARMYDEDISYMGSVSASDARAARKTITGIYKKLVAEGKAVFDIPDRPEDTNAPQR